MFGVTKSPMTLSKEEQARLLDVLAKDGNPRDLALVSLALATGLRLRELVGLNVGHVAPNASEMAWRIDLPKSLTKGGRGGVAFLSRRVRSRLVRYLAWKAALFQSRTRWRISLRRVQVIFAAWQQRAGFERIYNFHALRHTAITNVYRATKDLYLTQRFARHASPLTTTAYTHPSDEELYSAISRI